MPTYESLATALAYVFVLLLFRPRVYKFVPLPGDANFDNAVTLDDFAIIRQNFGSGDRFRHGDFDRDLDVDLNDFNIIKENFGNSQAVPEPTTILLLAVGFTSMSLIRRYRSTAMACAGFALALLLSPCSNGEPVRWPMEDGGNGHFYEAISVGDGLTWPEADAAAKAAGGFLATLGSPEENEFVFSLVNDNNYWQFANELLYGPWLGGFQRGRRPTLRTESPGRGFPMRPAALPIITPLCSCMKSGSAFRRNTSPLNRRLTASPSYP